MEITGKRKVAIVVLTLSAVVPALLVSGFVPELSIAPLYASIAAGVGGVIAGFIVIDRNMQRPWAAPLCGALVGLGALWVTIFYASFRDRIFSLELGVVAIVGAIPGLILFVLLTRR